ncbi:MAG TPA: dihydrofolate reductase family protein [Solirubrobacteraceae bacterium]|nr:dihydrofolate reductase family protein [Solirubrobacteraceae bacterium]
MRKLIESTIVSLDGVIESPDRWAVFDQEAVRHSMAALDGCDAFVMGRVAYERLRAMWEPVSGNPYIDAINAMPKYVASSSLTDVGWNATLLGSDVVQELERIKAGPGKDLIKYGTSRLDSALLGAGLIDELRVWIMPVVVGSGRRLFEDVDTTVVDLRLTEVHKLDNGSAILSYVPELNGRAPTS